MKRSFINALTMLTLTLTLTSCALMLPDRSFIAEMERESESFYNPGKDFPVVSGDTGEVFRSRDEIQKRTPASARSRALQNESDSLTEELQNKEVELSEEEMISYAKSKKYLDTESDKLYYLSLSVPERDEYIQTKKDEIQSDLDIRKNFVQNRSIHSSELYLGMEKDQVVQVWGKPARVEIAGNPTLENERWSFVEDGNVKKVYFEGGKVQGWALDL